jgi:3-hydroxyacyl-CoA dehydrogenase
MPCAPAWKALSLRPTPILPVQAIVLTGTGRFFSAGADITEFASGMKEPFLPQVIDTIEASPSRWWRRSTARPWAEGWSWRSAATTGLRPRTCASWGCPRSSSASFQVPADATPAAGDRRREGAGVDPERGLHRRQGRAAAGLIDKIAEGDVVAEAVAFAKAQTAKPPRRIGQQTIDAAKVPAGLFEKARASIARHPSGPLAPKCASTPSSCR